MPIIGLNDDSSRTYFLKHILEAGYKFKATTLHGFELNQNLEIGDLKSYQKAIKEITVFFNQIRFFF